MFPKLEESKEVKSKAFPQPLLICPSPFFQIFRVVCICLGNPPETFTWEYRDKDKNYQRIGPITPLEFYREHVKPLFNMENKVGDWHWQPLAIYFQIPVDYKERSKILCLVIKLDTEQTFFSFPLRYFMYVMIKLVI